MQFITDYSMLCSFVGRNASLQVNLSLVNSCELKGLVHSSPPVWLWNGNVIWEPFPSATVISASSWEKVLFCTKSLKKKKAINLLAILLLLFPRSHCELIGTNSPVNRLWLQRMSFLLPFNCRWKLLALARHWRGRRFFRFSERFRWWLSQWNSLNFIMYDH